VLVYPDSVLRAIPLRPAPMVDSSNLRLALFSAAVLGFRHGLDYDHIAAITDISSVQTKARDAMRFGLLYVAGHAATVAALGTAAIAFRVSLPPSTDRWAERLVGITLVVLGVYVLGSFVRSSLPGQSGAEHAKLGQSGANLPGHSHMPRTRITLLVNGVLWLYWRLSRIFGGSRPEAPQVFKDGYGTSSTFLVGVIHGLGAETPTQLLLFLVAANLGGTGAGLLGLLMFIVGLLAMNTLMCASAAGLFRSTLSRPRAMRALTLATSAYSVVVGAIFLFGPAGKLFSLTG
jgi:high-affinity nickel permease